MRFKSILEQAGVSAYVRQPRGRDIYAACGQLAAKHEPNTIETVKSHPLAKRIVAGSDAIKV